MTLTEIETLKQDVRDWKSFGTSSKFPIHTATLEKLINAAVSCKREFKAIRHSGRHGHRVRARRSAMTNDIDELEEIAAATRISTNARTDTIRKPRKRWGSNGEREYVAYSTAKPTLPKLKFLEEK